MKPLHAIMAAGLLVAAWFAFFGDKTPDAEVVALPSRLDAARRNPQQDARPSLQPGSTATRAAAGGAGDAVILPLKPRTELISIEKSAARGDLFARQAWVAPMAASVDAPARMMAPAPPPIPALTYVGKKQEDGIWEVYVSLQDQLFIVKEKTVIDGKYRVESIAPPTLVLTYLPSSKKQIVMIGDAQ